MTTPADARRGASPAAPAAPAYLSLLTLPVVVAALGVVFSWVLAKVNEAVPEPYMDEIFHVPQAQQYCAGRFDEWDPKITTFPGVYLVATLYAQAGAWLASHDGNDAAFCSVSVLRSVNVLFAIGNVVLCVLLRRRVAPADPNAGLHALRTAAFPPLVFFAFLFYTDGGATFFVLLMYLLAERVDLLQLPPARGSFVLSALSGAMAVLFRQTNIVWVLFVAGTVVVRCTELAQTKFIYGSLKEEAQLNGTSIITNGARRVFLNFLVVVASNLPSILAIAWPFVMIVTGFAAFLVKNGGVVVGDKSNHEVRFHGAQVLYFIAVTGTGFGLSLAAPSELRKFTESVGRNTRSRKGLLFIVSVTAASLITVWRFSPVHKFMLADNRHYTFYVWRKFFLKHVLAKFVPIPLYLYLGWRSSVELRRRRSPLWRLVFALAICLVLIPSPLVEPRYYCVPFIIFHLNTGNQSALHQWTALAAYMAVNVATLYIFLYRPYEWVDGSTARFMW